MFVCGGLREAVWDRLAVRRAWKIGAFGRCADADASVALDDSKDRGRNRFRSTRAWPVNTGGAKIPSDGAAAAPPQTTDLPSSLLTPAEQVADRRQPQARPVPRRTVCDDGVAGASRCAPRHATVGKTVRQRSDRRRPRFATDVPATSSTSSGVTSPVDRLTSPNPRCSARCRSRRTTRLRSCAL